MPQRNEKNCYSQKKIRPLLFHFLFLSFFMNSYSLLELNQYIRQQVKSNISDLYWVVAEINEFQVNSSGHCFMELVEKGQQGGQIIARSRANIWAYHFRMLSPYFETVTGRRLSAGMKVMLQASVEFHEIYGISLQVVDIDPAYTLGDLAVQRQAVIKQLVEDGVFDMNHELELPFFPQRIAVISSETAAGYGDFVNQLHGNHYGFTFFHTLFRATVQGNEAEKSILEAFEQIFEREEEFDAVVLIRGGGSQSDLNCFNGYPLAACIAQFTLPVITGIGHDRDETVADLVACVPLKTPTAVAEFLINKAVILDNILQELSYRVEKAVELELRRRYSKLQQLSQRLNIIANSHIRVQDRKLHVLQNRLENAARSFLLRKKQEQYNLSERVKNVFIHYKGEIARLEEKIQLLDPVNLLQRGFSITYADGKVVRNAKDLERNTAIETLFHDGKIKSIVS